jgi:hypothetical protein
LLIIGKVNPVKKKVMQPNEQVMAQKGFKSEEDLGIVQQERQHVAYYLILSLFVDHYLWTVPETKKGIIHSTVRHLRAGQRKTTMDPALISRSIKRNVVAPHPSCFRVGF